MRLWVTPEGKAVDVTNYRHVPKETITFFPVMEVSDELDTYDIAHVVIAKNWMKHGVWIKDFNKYKRERNIKTGIPIMRLMVCKNTPEDIVWYNDGGGFSSPSTATGKYPVSYLEAV